MLSARTKNRSPLLRNVVTAALGLFATVSGLPTGPTCAPRLAAAQQKGGKRLSVIIDSSPPGATVYVDGRDRGPACTSGAGTACSVPVTRGEHWVVLELPGYKPVEQKINVSEARRFAFALQIAGGRLEIRTPGTNRAAQGAQVLVDGQSKGTVPVLIDVAPGMRTVEVRKPGFRPFREVIDVRAGETATKWVALQAQATGAALTVDADVRGAQVLVDGQLRGTTPARIEGLSEGDHRVEVRRPGGGQPWLQMVRVGPDGGYATASFSGGAAQQGQFGTLIVVGNGEAEVLVDGVTRGRLNQPIGNVRPGQHLLEVRGPGITASRTVSITAGRTTTEQVESKEDLRGTGTLRVIMANPVDGARYFINGRQVDEAAILNERGIEVGAGPVVVVVRADGFGEQRREITMRPKGVELVTLDLRDTGQIQVLSEPRGAEVYLDKALVGYTPKVIEEARARRHLIELRLAGHVPYIEQVVVRGGEKATVNAKMVAEAGPAPDDTQKIKGLTSFSAVTIPTGHFTLDVGAGYPYLLNIRLNVGIFKAKSFGIDAGGEVRTNFYETDVGANIRAQLLKLGPIALGGSIWVGGGGGPRRRNSFTFEAGIPMTLLAGNLVKLTLRPYLQYYSDRLCPSQDDLVQLRNNGDFATLYNLIQPEHVGDRCASTLDNTTVPPVQPRYGQNAIAAAAGIDPVTKMAAPMSYNPDLTITGMDGRQIYVFREDGNPVLDRFTGVRFMLQAVVEIAITPNASIWALIEGAPGQGSRQQYTDKFNRLFPIDDFPLYGRIGYTAKF